MGELDRYLEQLRRELPLPPTERDGAVEEIATHIADATAELTALGVDTESAQHRVISRFGPPDRLADQLAAARRGRWQLATAIGTALRTSLGTGFWAVAVGGATLYVALLAAVAAAHAIGGWLGWDLSALSIGGTRTSIVLGSVVAAGAAYAVGRALPPAVSLGARQREATVRPWVLAIGASAAAVLGFFVIEATFEPLSALLTAALPLWFALGVLRPKLLPGWFPGHARTAGLVLLLVAVLVVLPLGFLASARGNGTAPEPIFAADPVPSYGRIAPLDADADLRFASSGSWSAGIGRIYEYDLADASSLAGWSDLHLEIWVGLGPESGQGVALVDPSVAHPLTSTPISVDHDGHVSVTVTLPVVPERDHYVAALVGTSPDGARLLLAYPQDELALWNGSVWDYLTVKRPW